MLSTKANVQPAITPGSESGSTIRRNVCHRLA